MRVEQDGAADKKKKKKNPGQVSEMWKILNGDSGAGEKGDNALQRKGVP